jgi:dipeptidase D
MEEKILEYLVSFARDHKLDHVSDPSGNLLIKKPAATGFEQKKPVILQSHVDMVCEKNLDTNHDFNRDPIKAYIDGDWVKAMGTTLGADDGIGMAAQLAILSSPEVRHGPLECLFTVDEESGMTGAKGLQKDFLAGKILINLDSEDEGELFIGCAGGMDTTAMYTPQWEPADTSMLAFRIVVNGLKGGHSGDEIHKGLGNSIKILNRFLWNAFQKFHIRIGEFNGGHLRNAIPREAAAIIMIKPSYRDEFMDFSQSFSDTVASEIIKVDPKFRLSVEQSDKPANVFSESFMTGLLQSIYACPHGDLVMSKDIPGLVETSTNLAAIKQKNQKQIEITTSQRSSVASAKFDAAQMVASSFRLSGAKIVHDGAYPGWTPNTESEILGITRQAYKDLYQTEPEVKAIHAGLECGLFLEKYPDLDMISFGPTIRGAHSPDEKLNIPSTYKFWDLLQAVLKNIPDN